MLNERRGKTHFQINCFFFFNFCSLFLIICSRFFYYLVISFSIQTLLVYHSFFIDGNCISYRCYCCFFRSFVCFHIFCPLKRYYFHPHKPVILISMLTVAHFFRWYQLLFGLDVFGDPSVSNRTPYIHTHTDWDIVWQIISFICRLLSHLPLLVQRWFLCICRQTISLWLICVYNSVFDNK